MFRTKLIAAAAALFAMGSIHMSTAQAAGVSSALAGANPAATASTDIIKTGRRGGRGFRRFRRFHHFHGHRRWRHYGYYRGCGHYWWKYKRTGYRFWKRRYYDCKYGY